MGRRLARQKTPNRKEVWRAGPPPNTAGHPPALSFTAGPAPAAETTPPSAPRAQDAPALGSSPRLRPPSHRAVRRASVASRCRCPTTRCPHLEQSQVRGGTCRLDLLRSWGQGMTSQGTGMKRAQAAHLVAL